MTQTQNREKISFLMPNVRQDGDCIALSGDWTLKALDSELTFLRTLSLKIKGNKTLQWDLCAVTRMDSVGALLLWRHWGFDFPAQIVLPPHVKGAFERIKHHSETTIKSHPHNSFNAIVNIGHWTLSSVGHVVGMTELIGHIALETLRLIRRPQDIPWKEICASIYKMGVQAMPIAALLGFLIGVVLSYLFALQLKNYGANTYIINVLGIGIIRELGPLLVSVLVAGRTGSAITAQLGVMRVTEEIDALATMGVSCYQRLIFPKILALAIAMPLLVLWTSTTALIGGMVLADIQLDIGYHFFIQSLPRAVPISNLWIGLVKGVVFGVAISLIACYQGLRVKPNTESLSANTTSSVVSAITTVIVLDAVFAVLMKTVGLVLR